MTETATGLQIRPITIALVREHGGRLMRDHWEEVAKNKQLMVLDPMWDRYEALEEAGALISLGAFADGKLVGYSITIVTPHLHYAGLLFAQNDVVFIDRVFRGHGTALLHETERACAEAGARILTWHAKQNTALEAVLPRMGYVVHETIFSKELGV